jgi:hypothetical protein
MIRKQLDCECESMAYAISGSFLHVAEITVSVMPALVAGISIHVAMPCRSNRDCRDKRGNDG